MTVATDVSKTGVVIAPSSAVLAPGRVAGFMGDSFTAGTGSSNVVYSWPKQMINLAGALKVSSAASIFAGVGGERSDQILARLQGVLAQGAQVIYFLAGVNDASQGVSVSAFANTITQAIQTCKRAGVPIFVGTVAPRTTAVSSAAIRKLIEGYNQWIRTMAPGLGATVFDAFAGLVDTTTGDMAATFDSGDGIHPNNLGHRRIAQKAATATTALVGTGGMVTGVSAVNLNSNPLMTGTFGTNGYTEAAGGTGTAPTYSIVADSSGFLAYGSWLQMDFTATAGGTRTITKTMTLANWSVGDVLAITGKIQIEDPGGNWESVSTTALTGGVSVKLVNGSTGIAISSDAAGPCSGLNVGPMWTTVTVPGGVTSLVLWCIVTLPAGAHIKAKFGELDVLNLTQLGLTAIT